MDDPRKEHFCLAALPDTVRDLFDMVYDLRVQVDILARATWQNTSYLAISPTWVEVPDPVEAREIVERQDTSPNGTRITRRTVIQTGGRHALYVVGPRGVAPVRFGEIRYHPHDYDDRWEVIVQGTTIKHQWESDAPCKVAEAKAMVEAAYAAQAEGA